GWRADGIPLQRLDHPWVAHRILRRQLCARAPDLCEALAARYFSVLMSALAEFEDFVAAVVRVPAASLDSGTDGSLARPYRRTLISPNTHFKRLEGELQGLRCPPGAVFYPGRSAKLREAQAPPRNSGVNPRVG